MDFPHVVLARLYEHIEPIDRGDRYEDPLQAVLERANIGRVTGGGSQLNELGGIEYADVEIELANLDEGVRVVVEALRTPARPRDPNSSTHPTAASCSSSEGSSAWRSSSTARHSPRRSTPSSISKRS